MRVRDRFVAMVALVAAAAAPAAAEPRIKSLRFIDLPAKAEPFASRVKLQAVIGGAVPGLRAQDFSARIDEGGVPILIGADKSVPFGASDEELAVMILVQGTVRFMGNPEPAPGDPPIDGYYDVVKPAVDAIARARPRHTRVGLYVYGDAVVAKAPMGPADGVSGEALGAQKDYAATTTKALQRGFEEALRVLGTESGRRVLFVIGDGGDQREDYAPRRDLERLAAASIEVYALGASVGETSFADRHRLEAMGKLGAVRIANQKEQVPQLAETLANEINNVYSVEFPEIQASDRQMLPTDGSEHEVTIKVAVEETAGESLRFPGPLACVPGASVRCLCAGQPGLIGPDCPQPPTRFPRWAMALIGLALLAGGVGTVLILRRREEGGEAPDEPAEPAEPAPEPRSPPPMVAAVEPRRTQMLQLDDDTEGFPVVAWIVPIDGAAAFQTFRLSDRNVIGAAHDCDVRIEDPSISAHHAEIVLCDGDYVLIDRGSRNGVKFMDRRVKRHTLVDNDQFTLGATSFKFKWTE